MHAPIALFVYNRPEHTQKTLEALAQNSLAIETELWIFCDGSKTKDIVPAEEEVKRIVGEFAWPGKKVIVTRDRNYGLADSIINGVSEILTKFDRIIVLEDDLIVSPYFLEYMNENLVRFKSEPDIMHISGYVLPLNLKHEQVILKGGTSTWGWATWNDRWTKFESDAKLIRDKIVSRNLEYRFNFNNSFKYTDMLQRQIDGKIDSWGIRWYGSVFLNEGYGIWPQQSYVQNEGHDGTGVHCGKTDIYNHANLASKILRREFREIKEDKSARTELMRYSRKLNRISWKGTFKNMVKGFIWSLGIKI